MNNDWLAIQDPASGKTYYANQRTRATQWDRPHEFNGNTQPQLIYNQQSQNSLTNNQQRKTHVQPQLNQFQQKQTTYNKWKKAHDPSTGNDYWYNVDTKETQWNMPEILTHSVIQFDTVWSTDSDNDEDDIDDDSSMSDDFKVLAHSFVEDGSTSDDDFDEKIANPLNKDEVLVSNTSNKYWNIAQSEGDKYPLHKYANKYFQKHKHNKIFKKTETDELLKYAPYNKVRHALNKMDAKLDKHAQQIWKNLNSFMGLRKTSKSESGHVDKLLRFALKSAEIVRDEIFCQLCKQTNCNPSIDSLVKGWKLMAICCCIFPPSDQFVNYLATYLWHKTKEIGVIGKYAEFALHSLDQTMEMGQRRVQPINTEIQRIKQRQPIQIKVYFLDDTFKNILITSQTCSQQIVDSLAKVLQLNHSKSFGLFAMEKATNGWDKDIYTKRKLMPQEDKIDGLQEMIYDRELDINERIMDVITSWTRCAPKKNKTIRLMFKCKLQSAAQEHSYSINDWKLSFLTAVYNVIHGMYPVGEDDIWHLAALQLQAVHGIQENKSFYCEGIVQDVIYRYVPYAIIKKKLKNIKECELNILSKHGLYQHLDKVSAFRKYIEHLRKSNRLSVYFGNSFFRCVRVSRLRKINKLKNNIIDLLIGISENGILLIDPISLKIIERYKMEEIITYGFRSNAFLLVTGTLMTQRRFQFATMIGKEMNDLLTQHIDLRVQQAEAQGDTFQH